MPSLPATRGVHHIGLTVPDLEKTAEFFIQVLNFEKVGEVPDYPAIFVSDGTIMLTLWRAEEPRHAVSFNRRRNIGLHHFALKVESLDALKSLYQTLASREDVDIEFPPEPLGNSSTQHMMIYIPGGIRMELITFAA